MQLSRAQLGMYVILCKFLYKYANVYNYTVGEPIFMTHWACRKNFYLVRQL